MEESFKAFQEEVKGKLEENEKFQKTFQEGIEDLKSKGEERDRELERLTAEQKDTLTKELDSSSEKNKGEMIGLRDGMAELLDERVAEVKEQLQRQLGQVEAQLAAQKKVSRIS